MKFYISFGQTHVHRVNGKTFDADCLCEIEARNENEARDTTFKTFGQVWANMYEELDGNLPYFPRGVIALTDDSPTNPAPFTKANPPASTSVS